MRVLMNRREFASRVLATASVVLGAKNAFAFDYSFTPNGFIDEDRELLRNAMGGAMLLTRQDVIQNYVNIHSGGWSFGTSGAWDRSNNANNPNPAWRLKGNLLEYQVSQLSQTDAAIPIIVRGVHARNETWWGRANLNTIAVISDGEGHFSIEGGFEFELNTWQFNAPADRAKQSASTWGAVIAHEMLHNLGHFHEKGQYGNDFPINLYENCVGYGGKYSLGLPRHFNMICGGRVP